MLLQELLPVHVTRPRPNLESFKFDCAAGLRLPGVPSPGPPTGAEQSRLIVGNGVLSMLIGRGLTSGRV